MPLRLGLATAVMVTVIAVAGALVIGGPTLPTAPPSPSPVPSVSFTSPLYAATSPTAEADVVKGWPGNQGSSAPGLYSWDGLTCEPTNCVMGVIHNHGPGTGTTVDQVRISISRITEWSISGASATPVTVAGHQGLYLRIDPQLEEWNVDFDGTLLSITLSVKSGADEAVVAEANSIIESLVYEQRDTPLGFRLVFRLPSSQWDSPF